MLVRRTLGDLAVIRHSLMTATRTNGLNQPANSLLELELAAELKSLVDELRGLLWAYVQTLSAKSGRRPEEVLEWYKMQLAVEMLRNARIPADQVPRHPADRHTCEDPGHRSAGGHGCTYAAPVIAPFTAEEEMGHVSEQVCSLVPFQ